MENQGICVRLLSHGLLELYRDRPSYLRNGVVPRGFDTRVRAHVGNALSPGLIYETVALRDDLGETVGLLTDSSHPPEVLKYIAGVKVIAPGASAISFCRMRALMDCTS